MERNLVEAFKNYKEGADNEDSAAMFALGKFYEKNILPEGEMRRGMFDAISCYERAASMHNSDALTKLGWLHETGEYAKMTKENKDNKEDKKGNISKAIEYYKEAVALENPLAMNYLGLYYYNSKNYLKAKELFAKSRALGCARGANNLGVCFEQGFGVEKDFEQAVQCYAEAADKKYAQGMHNLGYLFLRKAKETNSVEYFEKAANWFRSAISEDQTLTDAYFYMGLLYEKGLGVDYNYQAAFRYYKKAAELGDKKAMKKCGDLLYSGSESFPQNKAESMCFYKKAADLNDPEAYNALGLLYEKGHEGLNPNESLALENYKKASELGCVDAEINISMMYSNGVLGKKDPEKAKEMMVNAAKKGNTLAKDYLAASGIIVPNATEPMSQTKAKESFIKGKREDPIIQEATNLNRISEASSISAIESPSKEKDKTEEKKQENPESEIMRRLNSEKLQPGISAITPIKQVESAKKSQKDITEEDKKEAQPA